MPFFDVVCPGQHESIDVFARVGEVIICPTCGKPTDRLWRASSGIQDVTWPGGRIFENLSHEPIRCDSPADLAREMKKRNLEHFVRHVDGDQHVARWSSISQSTLDGAKAMLERVGQAKSTDAKVPDYISSMTVTVTEEAGTVWAPRGTFGEN